MRYTKDHEWVRQEGEHYLIGISEHAVRQLGDIVFVELPEVGRRFKKGDAVAVVESVKAASDIYAPISGEIVEAHVALAETPGKLNEHHPHKCWFIRIKADDANEMDDLMHEDAYFEFIAKE